MFQHQLLERHQLSTEFRKTGKVYIAPDGEVYESVTTILGRHFKKDLSGWRRKVGAAEADRITKQAATKGTAVHAIAEKYLMNDEDYTAGTTSFNLFQFQQMKSLLDANIGLVYGVEYPLFSKRLRTAGTADLLCQWNGKPTVIDFKTSLKPKKEEWIESYRIQAATYGIMSTAMTGITFENFVIIIMVEHEEPQVFSHSVYPFVLKVKEIFSFGKD